jgi:hypothetical protein
LDQLDDAPLAKFEQLQIEIEKPDSGRTLGLRVGFAIRMVNPTSKGKVVGSGG